MSGVPGTVHFAGMPYYIRHDHRVHYFPARASRPKAAKAPGAEWGGFPITVTEDWRFHLGLLHFPSTCSGVWF